MGTTAIGFIDKVCVQSCIVLQCVPLPSNPALSTNERARAQHQLVTQKQRCIPPYEPRVIPTLDLVAQHLGKVETSVQIEFPTQTPPFDFPQRFSTVRLEILPCTTPSSPPPTVTPAYQKRIGQLSFMVEHVASHMANFLRIFINFQSLVHKTQKIRRNDQIVFQDDHPVVRLQNRSHPRNHIGCQPLVLRVAPRHSTV